MIRLELNKPQLALTLTSEDYHQYFYNTKIGQIVEFIKDQKSYKIIIKGATTIDGHPLDNSITQVRCKIPVKNKKSRYRSKVYKLRYGRYLRDNIGQINGVFF